MSEVVWTWSVALFFPARWEYVKMINDTLVSIADAVLSISITLQR